MQIRVRDIDQSEIFISLFRVFDGCFFCLHCARIKKNSFEIFELCFTSFGGSMSNWCIEAENESESKQKTSIKSKNENAVTVLMDVLCANINVPYRWIS